MRRGRLVAEGVALGADTVRLVAVAVVVLVVTTSCSGAPMPDGTDGPPSAGSAPTTAIMGTGSSAATTRTGPAAASSVVVGTAGTTAIGPQAAVACVPAPASLEHWGSSGAPPVATFRVPGTAPNRLAGRMTLSGRVVAGGRDAWLLTTGTSADSIAVPMAADATVAEHGVAAPQCEIASGAASSDGGTLWLDFCSRGRAGVDGPAVLARFDGGSTTPTATIDRLQCTYQLAVGGPWLWSVEATPGLVRIDSSTGAAATVPLGDGTRPGTLWVASAEAMWMVVLPADGGHRLVRVDGASATITASVDLPPPTSVPSDDVGRLAHVGPSLSGASPPAALGIANGDLWLVLPALAELWRLDPTTLVVREKRRIPGLTFGAGISGHRVVYHVLRTVAPAASGPGAGPGSLSGTGVLIDLDPMTGRSREYGPLTAEVAEDRGRQTIGLYFPTLVPDTTGWWYTNDDGRGMDCPCRYTVTNTASAP